MPVLINNASGLAEDLPITQANAALAQGSHEIPLNDSEGNAVTAPLSEAQDLLANGHTQPSPTQLQGLLDFSKYSSPTEQAKTVLSGVGRGATFGLSTALEDPAAHRGRETTNPGESALGEAVGLGASTLVPGVGEAGLLGRAGQAAKLATGLGEGSLLARTAGSAVKQATEMAILQGGDEVAKLISKDPEQTAQSAVVNIGLSGLLGAGTGAALTGALDPLWEKTKGSQLSQFLTTLRDKAVGTAASDIVGDSVAPEIRSAISGDTRAKAMAQELAESGTKAGQAYRDAVSKTYSDATDSALAALGRTREDLGSSSAFEKGEALKGTLSKEIKEQLAPIAQQYEDIATKYKGTELPNPSVQSLGEKIGTLATGGGYNLSESSPGLKEINRVIQDLPNIKTLEDLRKYTSIARKNISGMGDYALSNQVTSILRDAEENVLKSTIGEKAPEQLAQHDAARTAYRQLMTNLDSLNDRIHLGSYHGPKDFLTKLQEEKSESLLNRLSNQKDAGLLDLLQKTLPATADAVKGIHIDNAVGKLASSDAARPNINKMLTHINEWSPELKSFAIPPEGAEKLQSIKTTLDSLPKSINPSGTARTLETIWSKLPGGIGAMASLLSGHNPISGYVFGTLARTMGRELPDQGKLALLKFLGSEGPVNTLGFRSAYNYIGSAYKAAKTIDKAVGGLFKSGGEVLENRLIPTASIQDRLNQHLLTAQNDPEQLIDTSGKVGHYLPEHAGALGALSSRAVTYLNSLRPNTSPIDMLAADRVPTSTEEAKYTRALNIAQQPLMALSHIKSGTLLPEDLQTLNTIYPNLYNGLKDKIGQGLIDAKSHNVEIPYKTRLGLSMFLGMPVDSSIMPQNIMANTMQGGGPTPPQQSNLGQPRASRGQASAGKALNKLPSMSQTAGQASESRRIIK
jgi:hypothetical protein